MISQQKSFTSSEFRKFVNDNESEHDMQVRLVSEFKNIYPKLSNRIAAIPNGAKLPYRKTAKGKRYSPEANRLLAEGLLPGLMDIIILIPSLHYGALLIELKKKPNKPQPNQIKLITELENDYCVKVCYDDKEFWAAVNEYLK